MRIFPVCSRRKILLFFHHDFFFEMKNIIENVEGGGRRSLTILSFFSRSLSLDNCVFFPTGCGLTGVGSVHRPRLSWNRDICHVENHEQVHAIESSSRS